jgi:hypothetical protein
VRESFCSNPTRSTFLLARSVAIKRSFKKKASQGSKTRQKSMAVLVLVSVRQREIEKWKSS